MEPAVILCSLIIFLRFGLLDPTHPPRPYTPCTLLSPTTITASTPQQVRHAVRDPCDVGLGDRWTGPSLAAIRDTNTQSRQLAPRTPGECLIGRPPRMLE